ADEVNIGSKDFSSTDECEFSALVANNTGNGIACAPYVDQQISGFSVYRLEDGKDLGTTVFKDINECNLAVSYSYEIAYCSKYEGAYYFWSIQDNTPFEDGAFSSLKSCIVEMNKI